MARPGAGIARMLWPGLLVAACSTTSSEEPVADRPTLPFRVLVCGGAFLERNAPAGALPDSEREILAATTFPATTEEAIPPEQILQSLRDGRVFVESLLAQEGAGAVARRDLLSAGVFRATLDGAATFPAIGAEADRRGADVLLVIEGVRDGPLATTGTNGQWPIAVVAWITVGLGMFIPDHTFDSGAVLRASLREPTHGRLLESFTISAPALDLPLVSRSDVLGLISSIVVPPPLVGNDNDRVATRVQLQTIESLLQGLVRKLKSRETLANLLDKSQVRIRIRPAGAGSVLLELQSEQDLAEVRLLHDGMPVAGTEWREFTARLLASGRAVPNAEPGPLRFAAQSPPLADRPGELRILVRTVRGDFVSQTVRLPLEP
jgi:hypothetical protein